MQLAIVKALGLLRIICEGYLFSGGYVIREVLMTNVLPVRLQIHTLTQGWSNSKIIGILGENETGIAVCKET